LDTRAILTLIKLRNLKDKTLKREERMVLIGVTGHKIHTISKIRTTIPLRNRKIRHSIYVMKDDFPIDYEEILRIDFLQKQQATCDLGKKRFHIDDETLKLQPYAKSVLKPRTETIIQAITNSNRVGITHKNNARDIH